MISQDIREVKLGQDTADRQWHEIDSYQCHFIYQNQRMVHMSLSELVKMAAAKLKLFFCLFTSRALEGDHLFLQPYGGREQWKPLNCEKARGLL